MQTLSRLFCPYRNVTSLDLFFANCNNHHFINISEENSPVLFSGAASLDVSLRET